MKRTAASIPLFVIGSVLISGPVLNAGSGGRDIAPTTPASTEAAIPPFGAVIPEWRIGYQTGRAAHWILTLPHRTPGPRRPLFPLDFRAVDGSGNNLENEYWGAAGIPYRRRSAPAYADGFDSPSGENRPNVREISNAVSAQTSPGPGSHGLSDMLWLWGQFIDHDITETPLVDPPEPFDIQVPTGDPFFDPFATGTQQIPLDRSFYVHDGDGVRQQVNFITAYLDGSVIYGSNPVRQEALRALDGSGRLKVTPAPVGDLLPYNEDGLPNAGGESETLFLAGDVRSNEQAGLTALHTLFVREHNTLADAFRDLDPDADGDTIYERVRAVVAAELQVITYRDFLPRLLGPGVLPRYAGYRPDVDASIDNEFAAAAYRFGHSMLSAHLLRLDSSGQEAPEGHLALRDAFFNPAEIEDNGIESLLRGLAFQTAQEVDAMLVDDVRNFLFGPPGAGGFDLGSLNLQRGRDHGLGGLNDVREGYGLPPLADFSGISSDPEVVQKLAAVYNSVDDVDAWVGCLAEDPVEGGLLGALAAAVVGDQFARIRDGDRYWYRIHLTRPLVAFVERQTLGTIIVRNTNIAAAELPSDVFVAP